MALQCGIVGLPNVGKSTLFNALTQTQAAAAANYPFCTIEPNVGVVPLRDARLENLAKIFKSEKIIPTTVEFVDIAGLVAGASKGEGLGNQFLGNIRNVDAIVEVVRCFEDPDVVHVHGKINPLHDIEVIHTELALADLDGVDKRIFKLQKSARSGDKEAAKELEFFMEVKAVLEKGESARRLGTTVETKRWLKEGQLLTGKPLLYAANMAEGDLKKTDLPLVKLVRDYAAKEGSDFVTFSGKIESEIAILDEEERTVFLEELGLTHSGIDRMAEAAFRLLGLMTFLTVGPKEARAWTIKVGTAAPQAAGVIHSDFEKHFIRAEVYSYADLMEYGSETKLKEVGKIRLEGKDYIFQDGDVVHFRTSA